MFIWKLYSFYCKFLVKERTRKLILVYFGHKSALWLSGFQPERPLNRPVAFDAYRCLGPISQRFWLCWPRAQPGHQ